METEETMITVEDCSASIAYMTIPFGTLWQWQGPKDGMAPILSTLLAENPMFMTRFPWPMVLVAETSDAVIVRRADVERAN